MGSRKAGLPNAVWSWKVPTCQLPPKLTSQLDRSWTQVLTQVGPKFAYREPPYWLYINHTFVGLYESWIWGWPASYHLLISTSCDCDCMLVESKRKQYLQMRRVGLSCLCMTANCKSIDSFWFCSAWGFCLYSGAVQIKLTTIGCGAQGGTATRFGKMSTSRRLPLRIRYKLAVTHSELTYLNIQGTVLLLKSWRHIST